MPRRESDSLQASRRSNSLAFGPRHVLSTSSSYTSPSYPSYQTSYPNSSYTSAFTKSRSHGAVLQTVDRNGPLKININTLPHLAIIGLDGKRQVIRSLIPPDNSAMRGVKPGGLMKLQHRKLKRRGSTSSLASIKSITESIRAGRGRKEPAQTLLTLPTEILNRVLDFLPQTALHAVLLTSKALVEAAAVKMYHMPYFASTYRFAQFTYTVSHHRHYASLVRVLDVSYFTAIPQLQREPEAGWREWKFRNHSMYTPKTTLRHPHKPFNKRGWVPSKHSHPAPNAFLEPWALSRDIPLGGLIHVLRACEGLRVADLSRAQIAEDFRVVDLAYPPSSWTGEIFASDIPKSFTYKSEELRPVYNIHFIEELNKLRHLHTVIAKNNVEFSTLMVTELVDGAGPNLKEVNFIGSGLAREKPWAIEGSSSDVRKIIREMELKTPKSPDPRRRMLFH